LYLEHFQLDEAPFSITPDPRFVYLSERHRDGLAHLLYGVGQGGSGGFIQLTGEVGTGKTTLVRLLLEQLPAQTEVALVMNPRLDPIELVETICEELRLEIGHARGSLKRLVETLNVHLLARHADGWRVIVLIDEAQDLSAESLEQVRLLTNLETSKQKLLQMILVGQPELKTLLGREDLRQLAQRITARFHLTPLDRHETSEYVQHRLTVAGSTRQLFTPGALRSLYRCAGGIPRLINVIADRALLAAYVAGELRVQPRELKRAAAEVLRGDMRAPSRYGLAMLAWLLPLCVLLFAAGLYFAGPEFSGPNFDEPKFSGSNFARSSSDPPVAAPSQSTPASAIAPGPVSQPGAQVADALAPSLAQAIHSASGRAGETWRRWLELWGESDPALVASAQACPERVASGLVCSRLSGNLGRLAVLNRPVLLKLNDQGVIVPALLLALNAESVELELAGQKLLIGRGELERYWMGDYLALWKHPGDIPVQVANGAGRRAVLYLRQQMQRLGVATPRTRNYALAWRQVVREFQRSQGLVADGIVGPETWLLLFSVDPAGPRLNQVPARG